MIPRDLLSACPHRQFHTLPGLLDSWAALPNSNPNACMPMQGGSLYHFYDGLWYDPAEANSRPIVRKADTLPTEPTRHGHFLWVHALKKPPDINRKSRVLYPGPGFLSRTTWPSMPKKHYDGLITHICDTNGCSLGARLSSHELTYSRGKVI